MMLPGLRIQGREERRNAMAFNSILVNSLYSRESVLRAYGLDSKVCYLGVDTDKFADRHQQRERFVVSVGALIPEKNAEFIVKALGKVPAQVRPPLVWVANFAHVGYMRHIEQLAETNQVRFQLKQRIEDCELTDILSRARLMLYAPRLEPFGYAPIEANSCGLPVIAVAEGGVRESIEDGINGILIEPEPELMALAIERLMQDNETHQRLSENASYLARTKWSLASSIDRLEARLSATLAKARTT
ncbi:MAG: glycosyltransferase [Candidatus Acidiferrales bacterium]